MTIYVLCWVDYDDLEVVAVYSDPAQAKQAREDLKKKKPHVGVFIEERELDATTDT